MAKLLVSQMHKAGGRFLRKEETGNWVQIDTKDVVEWTYNDLATDAEAAPFEGAQVTVACLYFITKDLSAVPPTCEKCGNDALVNLQNFTGTLHFYSSRLETVRH